MYGMAASGLHHYPHHPGALSGNYGFSQAFQRSSASLASMYSGTGLGYSPGEWGITTPGGPPYLSRSHHQDYLNNCAGSIPGSNPLSLSSGAPGTHQQTPKSQGLGSHSIQPQTGQTFPGVVSPLVYPTPEYPNSGLDKALASINSHTHIKCDDSTSNCNDSSCLSPGK
ncbi:hypothetical protein LSH36_714g01019 [Paralvinella palmiformis]|uniref:Uncharacterized protein n=1 Tax=Paralvinella palmiformis TaxID=53620 RepID=A0AAD9J1J8_9ANNE|nr:hypothetical protein LSH36_714g01019 [Paralvinella palmiformis]